MISGFDFYRAYLAIKLHFTTKYDVIKYCGKTKASADDFAVRNDRLMFEKWGKRSSKASDAIETSVANFIIGEKDWVYGDVENGIMIYTKWKGIKSSLTYNITQDYNHLKSFLGSKVKHYDDFLSQTANGNKAPLLQIYLSGRLVPDTIVSLDRIQPFLADWTIRYSDDPLVTNELFKLVKYRTFSKPDMDKLIPIFNSTLAGEQSVQD